MQLSHRIFLPFICLILTTLFLLPLNPAVAQYATIYSEDFEEGEAGWAPIDYFGQQTDCWRHDTTLGYGVAWCGTYYDADAGYGNYWDQWLVKEFDESVYQVDFEILYELEEDLDFLSFLVSYDGGESWDCRERYTGASGGAFVNETVTVDPQLATAPIKIAFRVTTDAAWSDEDGLFSTTYGACRLDNIVVRSYSDTYVSNFDTDLDGWTASVTGSEADPYRLETYVPAWGYSEDDHFWAAYGPDGRFPSSGPCAPWIHIGIESPVINLAADQERILLKFDIFGDIPLEGWVYYDFEVRFLTSEGWTDFRTDYSIYGSTAGAVWTSITFDLSNLFTHYEWDEEAQEWVRAYSSIIEPGATAMQVRLKAYEWNHELHTAGPMFDDVEILLADGEGTLAGRVSTDCPVGDPSLHGVEVAVLESGTGAPVQSAFTNADGEFGFTLPVGAYNVMVIRPLGYSCETDEYEVVIGDGVAEWRDFALGCDDIAYEPQGVGYWKHQLTLAGAEVIECTGLRAIEPKSPLPEAKIPATPVCDYLDLIAEHFNVNEINQVILYEPPASGECAEKLAVAGELLNLMGSQETIARAKQQLMGLLLNVAARYVSQTQVVTEDGCNISQAITYCDNLIDDPEGDHALAKMIALKINNGFILDAGWIPTDTINIAYRHHPDAWNYQLKNTPNPFNPFTKIRFSLPVESSYTLSIFDSKGRLVRIYDKVGNSGSNEIIWDGLDRSGAKASSGVYFYTLETDSYREAKKMVLLK